MILIQYRSLMRIVGCRGPLCSPARVFGAVRRANSGSLLVQHRSLASRTRLPARALDYQPRSPIKPSQTSQSDQSSQANLRSVFTRRKIILSLTAIAGALSSLYLTILYRSISRDIADYADKDIPADVSDRYDSIADDYDEDVSFLEWFLGIDKLRKELCAKVTGHVLEVSVGTGRNMEYLPLVRGGIKDITFVDKSREMVEMARRKWSELTNDWFYRIVFYHRDARDYIPCPKTEGFDTVLQTMGICSCDKPEELLRSLEKMTRKETGRILLLEHGRSSYEVVNRWWIDRLAKAHADRYGCWFDKDVEGIVERSGLEIVERKRFHLGTTYWFVLKPSKEMVEEREREMSEKKAAVEERNDKTKREKSSWSLWWST